MDRLTANRYIALQQKIASSGGGVPQEIIDEVEALDAIVNGDETQDPPVVGLVDIVGDLENSVEDLDTIVNGDPTEVPPVPPLLASAGNMRVLTLWTNSTPTADFAAGNIEWTSTDYDMTLLVYKIVKDQTRCKVCMVPKGYGMQLDLAGWNQSNVVAGARLIEYVSDTKLSVGDATLVVQGSPGTNDNTRLIPLVLYGLKFMSH